MHPRDCPVWEYRNHSKVGVLADRCTRMLVSLRNGQVQIDETARDTRISHGLMFSGLTPSTCPYFAGHYRGERFRCLKFYEVQIVGDPRVGVPSERVAPDITNLADNIIRAGFSALKAGFSLPDSKLSPEEKTLLPGDFGRLIELHRDGDPLQLETYVLDCVAG